MDVNSTFKFINVDGPVANDDENENKNYIMVMVLKKPKDLRESDTDQIVKKMRLN